MWWTSSCGRIELRILRKQAEACSHQGPCDDDVEALSKEPAIAEQLEAIDPEILRCELREYGAWDDKELADHEQNLQRVLWIAAGDINEDIRRTK